jgi:hypothetical protein
VGLCPAESLDQCRDVIDEMADRVLLDTLRGIGFAVATQIRGDREASRLGQGPDLAQPHLSAFRKSMQEDHELPSRRPVYQGSKSKSIGLDHVLALSHLIDLMKWVATSSA